MKKEKTLNSVFLNRLYGNSAEIIIINGEAYACDDKSWNGELWSNCWQVRERDYKVINECEIYSRVEEVNRDDIPENILEMLESEELDLDEDGDWVQDDNKLPEDVSYMRSRKAAGDYRFLKNFYEIRFFWLKKLKE